MLIQIILQLLIQIILQMLIQIMLQLLIQIILQMLIQIILQLLIQIILQLLIQIILQLFIQITVVNSNYITDDAYCLRDGVHCSECLHGSEQDNLCRRDAVIRTTVRCSKVRFNRHIN